MGDAYLQLDPTFNSERFYQLVGLEITLSVQT